MKFIGSVDKYYKEAMLLNSEVGTLPLTEVTNGSFGHIVDTGVFIRFYEGKWYSIADGTVVAG